MSNRTWRGREKLEIVLEGLRGTASLAELCNRHGMTRSQYYQWRDRLMSEGEKLFARGGVDKEAERLRVQNQRLKETIGEMTLELKKNDW